MSKRLIALPVALVAMAVLVPGIASAAKYATNSSIAIAPKGNAFVGKVSSPRDSCVPNRKVTLQRKLQGQTKFVKVDTDKTNNQGKWSVKTAPKNGAQYRALVSPKKLSRTKTCKGTATKTLTARQASSTIAINSLGNAFTGKVTAISDCVSGRTVRLQRKNPGASSFANVGTADTTAANGTWSVATSPVPNAQYRASIAAKTSGSNACMAALSKVTTARKSNVTIQQGGGNFHGNVNSSATCESNRTVTLQRKGVYETTFHNIGADATNASGAWLVPTNVQSGASYRASVSAKQVGSTSCLNDLSPVVVAS